MAFTTRTPKYAEYYRFPVASWLQEIAFLQNPETLVIIRLTARVRVFRLSDKGAK